MNLLLAFLVSFSPLQDSVITEEAIDEYNDVTTRLINEDFSRCIARADSAIKASQRIDYLLGEGRALYLKDYDILHFAMHALVDNEE